MGTEGLEPFNTAGRVPGAEVGLVQFGAFILPALGPQLELTTEKSSLMQRGAPWRRSHSSASSRILELRFCRRRANCSHQAIAAPGWGSTGASEHPIRT